MRKFHIIAFTVAVLSACLHGEAQTQQGTTKGPKIQVIQLESLDVNEGLVTDEIAKRFDPKATRSDMSALRVQVENRISGMFSAALAQQLKASRLVQLAVRDESLKLLQKEWLVAEEIGILSDDDEGGIGVSKADHIAKARIEDLVADRRVFGNEVAAVWKNSITASLEIITVSNGTKKTITESVTDEGKGRKGVGGKAPDFDADQIRDMLERLSGKLAARIVDSYSPIKVIARRGNKIIVDRGVAAGIGVGDKFQLIEKLDDDLWSDAGFPLGIATVEHVSEETSNLDCGDALPPEIDKSKLTLKRQ